MILLSKPEAIIADVEGTITHIHFALQILIPFIKTHLRAFLTETWDQKETKEFVDRLRECVREEKVAGSRMPSIADSDSARDKLFESVLNNIIWQMDQNIKNASIKELHILSWIWGCKNKSLKGHVFDDVPEAFHKWKKEKNIKLYIFSSGMVVAQKLLLACSVYGNLEILIDGFFDSAFGSKKDPQSFKNIANNIHIQPKSILFLSDRPEEAKAAKSAGCQAVVVKRPANDPIKDDERRAFPVVTSLNMITFTKTSHQQ